MSSLAGRFMPRGVVLIVTSPSPSAVDPPLIPDCHPTVVRASAARRIIAVHGDTTARIATAAPRGVLPVAAGAHRSPRPQSRPDRRIGSFRRSRRVGCATVFQPRPPSAERRRSAIITSLSCHPQTPVVPGATDRLSGPVTPGRPR